ncbi:tyrosine-type recombinase/integrase [Kribbella sp. NPDC005582]|uniref:tyrosine-type recombinase/integrase n=1 Tax=Kribbella sp. NPDC005582 TaxID=3156893 RepID=UPI0033B8DDEC
MPPDRRLAVLPSIHDRSPHRRRTPAVVDVVDQAGQLEVDVDQVDEQLLDACPRDRAGLVSPAALALSGEHPIAGQIRDFLADQEFAGKAGNTIRAYRGDLVQLAQHTDRDVAGVDAGVLRSWGAAIADLAQGTRARKQAAVAAFLRWAVRNDLILASPMDRFERVAVPEGVPRPVDPKRIRRVIDAIPKSNLRDRLLYEILDSTGIRIGEGLRIYIEDLDLTPGDEHVLVHGKGGAVRTILLDDPRVVNLARRYLRETGWTHGPLFRATRNWNGQPLSYATAQESWARYRHIAGEDDLELHQLRHTHATELIKDGVSLLTVKKRLGHRKLQTTLVYTEHTDAAVDAELRARQRRRGRTPTTTRRSA